MTLFSFKAKSDEPIGNVLVKKINDSIFTCLRVVHDNDTIYRIDSNVFSNPHGKDLQAGKEGFYGYKVVLVKPDYFVVNCITNSGVNVSDDITLEWNNKKGILEVQKAP